MNSDDPSFEQFEELFDNEEEESWPEIPRFADEWQRNEVSNLEI